MTISNLLGVAASGSGVVTAGLLFGPPGVFAALTVGLGWLSWVNR